MYGHMNALLENPSWLLWCMQDPSLAEAEQIYRKALNVSQSCKHYRAAQVLSTICLSLSHSNHEQADAWICGMSIYDSVLEKTQHFAPVEAATISKTYSAKEFHFRWTLTGGPRSLITPEIGFVKDEYWVHKTSKSYQSGTKYDCLDDAVAALRAIWEDVMSKNNMIPLTKS